MSHTVQRNQLLQKIKDQGIVGAGGAGFPCHAKLDCSAETLIVNGAECEPLLHKDKELFATGAEQIIQGLKTAMVITGATRGVVAVKNKAKTAIAALRPLISPPVELHVMEDVYPAGDEVVLTYEVTGRVPPPGGLPIHVGAVVQNVETLWWVGGDASVTEKFLTIGGDLPVPVTLRVPIGVSIRQVLTMAGVSPHRDDFGVLSGGVMMGKRVTNLDDPVTKTLGGLIVLPVDHPLILRYERQFQRMIRIGRSACDQCNFCTMLCPRYLLGHPVQPHIAMRYNAMAASGTPLPGHAQYCCGCQLCTLWSCPEDLDPGHITFEYRRRILSGEGGVRLPETPAHPMYPFRKPPISALKRRLGLDMYTDSGPMMEIQGTIDTVTIPLQQHIGVPGVPVVVPGDTVVKGQVIGEIPSGKLGAPVHASIDGIVKSVGHTVIIERTPS